MTTNAKHDAMIREMYRESDGRRSSWWIDLRPGWVCGDDPDCHSIHEDTKREALARMRYVVPCDCDDCVAAQPPTPPVWTPATMGRKGGQSTSHAKAAAARANGRKGGRPRKDAT